MANKTDEQMIVALDIGTSKIVAIVAEDNVESGLDLSLIHI